MGEWDFLGGLFKTLQDHSPMLGRFWLLLMLVFRILILGTVASDLFEDEQEEFTCNTLQPGCKQVCYDQAFPISQYRFWVFHIVLIATPSLVFLMYAMHQDNKKTSHPYDYRGDRRFRRLYIVNVAFRIVAEIGFLVGQWLLYGFKVEAQFPCTHFPCPYTVDCFTSRPAEKTIFLCFYFIVGVISAISSCLEFINSSCKWFCLRQGSLKREHSYVSQNRHNIKQEEEKALGEKSVSSAPSTVKLKKGPQRTNANRKVSSVGHKPKANKYVNNNSTFVV